MSDSINNEDIQVTPEEQTAEREALAEVNSDELRDKIADEFGIDPDTEADLLDKLVKKDLANRERLSGAIKQKIKWRDQAKASTKPKETPAAGKTQNGQETPNVDELVSQKVRETLEQRDLEDMDLPDELQTQVKDLAKLKGISVKKAAQDPYILYQKEQMEKAKRVENATPVRSGRGSQAVRFDVTKPLNPDDFNIGTPEGAKAWKEARAAQAKHRRENS
jgi:ribosome-binding protein aMBF1 (putative translation factor)